jgi:hypothetical protein
MPSSTGTTNIYDLPDERILETSTAKNIIDQSTINELVSGIENLRQGGVTSIPTRDIPNHTQTNVLDPETIASYIPIRKSDKNLETDEEEDKFEEDDDKRNTYLEKVYEDVQMPMFVGVLYFLFQLPVFKKYLFYFFPNLISGDGNYNLGGYVFTSILFSLIFYLLNKVSKNL